MPNWNIRLCLCSWAGVGLLGQWWSFSLDGCMLSSDVLILCCTLLFSWALAGGHCSAGYSDEDWSSVGQIEIESGRNRFSFIKESSYKSNN
jgi:hypothetical protein